MKRLAEEIKRALLIRKVRKALARDRREIKQQENFNVFFKLSI